MKTGKELVKDGFRESNLLAVNVDVTAAQEVEALSLLNSFLESLYGVELGVFNMDWPTPPSTTSPVLTRYPLLPANQNLAAGVWPYPPENVRLLLNLIVDTKLYLPPYPNDGARVYIINIGAVGPSNLTLDGNGRLVKGLSSLVDTPGNLNQTRLLYRADLGDWVVIEDITAVGNSPLPAVFDDLLSIGLAIRLGPRYGRGISKETAVRFSQLMKRLKTQYAQILATPNAAPQPFLSPASSKDGTSSRGGGNLF